MSKSNSIRPASYLLYLIILITTGCTEKTTKHVFFNEIPPSVNQQLYTESFRIQPETSYPNHIADSFSASIEPEFTVALTKAKPLAINKPKVTKSVHKTVWDRLLSLYALPEVHNARIEREIQKYLKHPKFITKIQQRAAPYLYFILDEIEAKQIPGELALLPVVESAFIPNARSRSNALGLWQFMPATGRLFGLKQNWWYDGRRDIYKSTRAATTYLKQLSESNNNDWALALASYNAGKGYINKVIRKNKRRNKPTDYWSLPLYKETMHYVPKLMAIAKIFANAEKYNIPLLDIPNKPYFSKVDIQSPFDLNIAAKMANMPSDAFFNLNPAFKRSSINKEGVYHLLVHTDKAENFKNQLALTPKKDRIKQAHRHKIKSGENLSIIAKKYNTSVVALRKNNQLSSKGIIKAGQMLLIPNSSDNTAKLNRQTYIVKKGDTFWDIARQFSVLSKDIAHWNNISLTTALQPGQRLIIEES
jgi:membrane-bound lytic murein transglycosylase D